MMKRIAVMFSGFVLGFATAAPASAAQIVGSFSLISFSGSFVGGTAATATGLDFGTISSGSGNGYGTNGSALVGNASGSFASLNGTLASIADISLAAFANPYLSNPFISFAGLPITLNFSDASFTRSPFGTSLTIFGTATFSNGDPAQSNIGTFTLATSSRNGSPAAIDFTFTGNASTAVPEPASWAMMVAGFGLLAAVMRRRRAPTLVRFA